jgi:hypothetical protein
VIYTHGGGEFEAKSWVFWIREGNKCTKFFHLIANSNRRKNSIDSFLAVGFIKSLYTDQGS